MRLSNRDDITLREDDLILIYLRDLRRGFEAEPEDDKTGWILVSSYEKMTGHRLTGATLGSKIIRRFRFSPEENDAMATCSVCGVDKDVGSSCWRCCYGSQPCIKEQDADELDETIITENCDLELFKGLDYRAFERLDDCGKAQIRDALTSVDFELCSVGEKINGRDEVIFYLSGGHKWVRYGKDSVTLTRNNFLFVRLKRDNSLKETDDELQRQQKFFFG